MAPPRKRGSKPRPPAVIDYQSRWLGFPERLKAAREYLGWLRGEDYTRVQLANDIRPILLATPIKDTGTGRNSIHEWETRKAQPSIEKILAAAIALKMDPGWLAFGSRYSQATAPAWALKKWPETGGEPPEEAERRVTPRVGVLRPAEYPHQRPRPDGHGGPGTHADRTRDAPAPAPEGQPRR